jgi:hypothetical protein
MTEHFRGLQDMTIIVVGGYTDAPGFKIVIEGGRILIVPIPGWNPEFARELGSALKVAGLAGSLKNAEASQVIMSSAIRLAAGELSRVVGNETTGNTVVVAM